MATLNEETAYKKVKIRDEIVEIRINLWNLYKVKVRWENEVVKRVPDVGEMRMGEFEREMYYSWYIYRVSRGECARLRENVAYVKVHRYNPKHLYLKLNGYGDNGERKMRSCCGSTYCTCFACCYPVHCACPSFSLTAKSSTFRLHYKQMLQLQWIVIQYCWIFMCHVKCLEP